MLSACMDCRGCVVVACIVVCDVCMIAPHCSKMLAIFLHDNLKEVPFVGFSSVQFSMEMTTSTPSRTSFACDGAFTCTFAPFEYQSPLSTQNFHGPSVLGL